MLFTSRGGALRKATQPCNGAFLNRALDQLVEDGFGFSRPRKNLEALIDDLSACARGYVADGFSWGFTIVEDDLASWGGKRSLIEVKGAPELVVSGESGVKAGRAYHVEGHDSLGDETIPLVGGEKGVTSMEVGNEVVLECLDCSFSKIQAMVPRGSNLIIHMMLFNLGNYVTRNLVVQAMEDGNDASFMQLKQAFFEHSDQGSFPSVLDGGTKDIIRIKVVEDKDVGVALGRCNRKASGRSVEMMPLRSAHLMALTPM